ncbi:DNA repair protein RecO [Marinobacter sp. SS21]|uniref:DNA repair protein RecO n=1 Tax=Marinobacter sp. SS21 TaxID=2979460 RepID=UPI0023310D98|nr:DNA repair protein RecO [Marinobacter sp. SS21]MDC0662633.1 DNA repair protein RecO [Marinobacter sp. SS21]
MSRPLYDEPAYVLHRRPYRDSSLLVDLFSLNGGRLTVVARGANSPKSPLKAQLQPFQPLLVDWQGRNELKTLLRAEVRSAPAIKGTLQLYSGLYLNELLQRILPSGDPYPELFAAYIDVLNALASSVDVEPLLRRFERTFAQVLGVGFEWDQANDAGVPVESQRRYGYDPEQGIVRGASETVRLRELSGQTLLRLAAGDYQSPDCRQMAKRVMRVLIDHLLQGRPLHSRALFRKG